MQLFNHWRISPLFLLFVLASCSKPDKYAPITEDYCGQLTRQMPPPLSEQLRRIDSLRSQSTAVHVLEEGDEAMISRAWLTESAQKTIDIQYFIFSTDNVGLIATDYLLRAADRGVEVRVIVDDIMVEADGDDLLALDAHPHIAIRIYNPTANVGKNVPEKLYQLTTGFREFNQRMHNKTFIVDNQVVITGGRNIADEYFDYDHEYNFRDRDILLIGTIAQQVSTSFEQFWNSDLSAPVAEVAAADSLNIRTKYEYLHQYSCNPANFWPEVRERINNMPGVFQSAIDSGKLHWVNAVNFVSDVPGKNDGSDGLSGSGVTTDSLAALLSLANESITIQSPYLITTDRGLGLFSEASKRGVKIRILTNSLSSTDNLEAFSGYKRNRDALLAAGVEIYEFKPNAEVRFQIMKGALQRKINFAPVFGLHAKSMVIDRRIAVVGTFNLDPRSANLNTECVAIVRDAKVAKKLFSAMETDMRPENAWHTTSEFNPDSEAGSWKRFKAWTRNLVPESIL